MGTRYWGVKNRIQMSSLRWDDDYCNLVILLKLMLDVSGNDAITRYEKEANLPVAEDVFEVRHDGRVPSFDSELRTVELQAPERLADCSVELLHLVECFCYFFKKVR